MAPSSVLKSPQCAQTGSFTARIDLRCEVLSLNPYWEA
jgi:hypothetical protein